MPKIIIDVDFKDKKCEKFCYFFPGYRGGECNYFNEQISFGFRCDSCLAAEEEYKELADI